MHGTLRDQPMKKFRVAEIFGPTIQGEGRHIGIPCYFIRFGGCDYRCVWCDSPHAVLPALVAELPSMAEEEILHHLQKLPGRARWVVYSGGNPALFDLYLLTTHLQSKGYSVMIETQGTVWKDWLEIVDEVCVSPKPPSSHNTTNQKVLGKFLSKSTTRTYLKIVVFNEEDYRYAKRTHQAFSDYEMFLSVGNLDGTLPTVSNPNPKYPSDYRNSTTLLLNKTRALMERVARDEDMRDVRVLPQLHVLAWGNVRGR